MSSDALEALRARVCADPSLAAELAQTSAEHFSDALVARARAMDLDVTPADVEEAMAAGRRAWTTRWIR